MVKYIDFTHGGHTKEEHYAVINELKNDGYTYTGNTFGNPYFHHFTDRSKPDVCILAGIVEQEGYFAI